jgi:voltage-gated potassium channel Kch
MGYMYFSIYTITTTGYGDVVPTTPYAKLVTSLANVFAIFFLVGFINALISLKAQRKEA